MKRFFAVCVFVVLLVAATGCTQTATTTPTPVPTAVVTTQEPTPDMTMPPATAEPTAAPTAEATPAATAEVTTAVAEETTPAVAAETTAKPELTFSKTTTIYIRNNSFVPQEMMVLPGTGIRWVNDDRTLHQIKTLPDTKVKFTSADLVNGATFSYTFGENEGTFGYFDTYTNATGVIIIKKGSSIAGAPPMQTHATVAP